MSGAFVTVTGEIEASSVRRPLPHEHLFVDFLGPTDPAYVRVDWDAAEDACTDLLVELGADGVDLLIDWTCLGVGRDIALLVAASRRSGVPVMCATGVYGDLLPPELEDATADDLTTLFVRELDEGIEGRDVCAGFVKIAVRGEAPSPHERVVHRAAARSAHVTGTAIGLHSVSGPATASVADALEEEGFDLQRLVWAHAQYGSQYDHAALAERGVVIQFDGISGLADPDVLPDPEGTVLASIEALVAAGHADRVLVSTDATVVVNPASYQYAADHRHLYRVFSGRLRGRVGGEVSDTILRLNVRRVFARSEA